ncbi:MAG TPA: mechanosensitive ion channel family protein [Actinopolymorphaceae bacterium]|jgi:small conductance mechanosensitive channel
MSDAVFALTASQHDVVIVIVRVAVLIVLAVILRFVLNRVITRVVGGASTVSRPSYRLFGGKHAEALAAAQPWRHERQAQRAAALGSFVRSIVAVAIVTVTLFMALNLVGYNLAPLLASAGVVGVALGFGAQNLVKDFLAGVAMLVEDQFGVGDVVDLEKASGTVEAVGLRVTRLRDATGMIWYVRNGEVLRVGNKSQGWSQIMLDVQIAYDQDVDQAREVVDAVVAEVAADPEFAAKIVDLPAVVGIEQVTGSAVTLRVLGTCMTNENFAIQREIRLRLKGAFDREGVRLPAPVPAWGAAPGVPPGPTPGAVPRP